MSQAHQKFYRINTQQHIYMHDEFNEKIKNNLQNKRDRTSHDIIKDYFKKSKTSLKF